MYHVFLKVDDDFEPKKHIADYSDIEKAYEKIDEILEKDKSAKYILEETTGHFDNYGELVSDVIDSN